MPKRGLEPPRLAALVPKTSAYTNFATSACVFNNLYGCCSDYLVVLQIPRRKPPKAIYHLIEMDSANI
jgi:hypothetical protein